MIRETIGTLLYGLHIILHPFEGFWTLKHSKKCSFRAALIILTLLLLMVFAKMQLSGFLFSPPTPEESNLLLEMLTVIGPLAMWVVLNWSITTLFDGKGKMHEIFVFTCFSLLPLVLIEFPLVLVSHVLSFDEAVFYYVGESVAMVWSVFLILAGCVSYHEYSMFKSITTAICTLLGIAAAVFLLMVVYSSISQLLNFFVTIFTEIRYW